MFSARNSHAFFEFDMIRLILFSEVCFGRHFKKPAVEKWQGMKTVFLEEILVFVFSIYSYVLSINYIWI